MLIAYAVSAVTMNSYASEPSSQPEPLVYQTARSQFEYLDFDQLNTRLRKSDALIAEVPVASVKLVTEEVEQVESEPVKPIEPADKIAHGEVVKLPSTLNDMYALDLTSNSEIPVEFWNHWLPDVYKSIAPSLVDFDSDGINAAWVVAVIITECGRTAKTVGSYNYFNFTVDTLTYANFSSPEDCMAYARSWIKRSFLNHEWHKTRPAGYCKLHEDGVFTIERVNEHYAINPDGSVNWKWSQIVANVMLEIYTDYYNWRMDGNGI